MKPHLCRLEFGVACLADIRLLIKDWDRILALEPPGTSQSALVAATVDDRLPEEQVSLNFYEIPEVLDRFLGMLEKDGLRFTRNETIPGFFVMCRVDQEPGGLRVLDTNGYHGSENGPKD